MADAINYLLVTHSFLTNFQIYKCFPSYWPFKFRNGTVLYVFQPSTCKQTLKFDIIIVVIIIIIIIIKDNFIHNTLLSANRTSQALLESTCTAALNIEHYWSQLTLLLLMLSTTGCPPGRTHNCLLVKWPFYNSRTPQHGEHGEFISNNVHAWAERICTHSYWVEFLNTGHITSTSILEGSSQVLQNYHGYLCICRTTMKSGEHGWDTQVSFPKLFVHLLWCYSLWHGLLLCAFCSRYCSRYGFKLSEQV